MLMNGIMSVFGRMPLLPSGAKKLQEAKTPQQVIDDPVAVHDVLNKAMDFHDIGRGRGGIDSAIARVRAPSLIVSISSDTLYPPLQQREMRDALVAAGRRCDHHLIDSPQGHDGFLLEFDHIGPMVTDFLAEIEKQNA